MPRCRHSRAERNQNPRQYGVNGAFHGKPPFVSKSLLFFVLDSPSMQRLLQLRIARHQDGPVVNTSEDGKEWIDAQNTLQYCQPWSFDQWPRARDCSCGDAGKSDVLEAHRADLPGEMRGVSSRRCNGANVAPNL